MSLIEINMLTCCFRLLQTNERRIKQMDFPIQRRGNLSCGRNEEMCIRNTGFGADRGTMFIDFVLVSFLGETAYREPHFVSMRHLTEPRRVFNV